MPKVEKRHLTDQVFHARGDVLKAGRRENTDGCGRIPEIRVQGESVLVFDHGGIIMEKNRRRKRMEIWNVSRRSFVQNLLFIEMGMSSSYPFWAKPFSLGLRWGTTFLGGKIVSIRYQV